MGGNVSSRRQSLGRLRLIMHSLVMLALGATSGGINALQCPAVVVGTNNAAIDVPQVQEAVDGCSAVRLRGTFSFASTATDFPLRVVTVRTSVDIAGQYDDEGRLPQIRGGYTPILVDAPGSIVQIRALRFVNPVSHAVKVIAAMEAVVANCTIKGLVADGALAFGIAVSGTPESSINRVKLVNNTISDPSMPVAVGIIIDARDRRAIASTTISSNEILATAHGVDLRSVGGIVKVNQNRITIANSDRSGDAGAVPQLVNGIRCWGTGACNIFINSISSEHPNSAGIRLQGSTGAIVENNRIQMSPPDGSTPGLQNSGVQLIESSKRNLVSRNQVSGAARTAYSVSGPSPDYIPADNVLVRNLHPDFASSFVDTEIAEGALRTVVVDESGSISDLGTASVVR